MRSEHVFGSEFEGVGDKPDLVEDKILVDHDEMLVIADKNLSSDDVQ